MSGKAFRYLKRVIVTPAVYWRFTRLNPSFTCQHWAGVAPSTHPYGLAGSYVFIKQSNLPSHCDQLLHIAGTPYPKVTELICRIPLAGYPNTPKSTKLGAPVSDLGTETQSNNFYSLFKDSRNQPIIAQKTSNSLLIHQVLTITVLP